MAKNDRNKSSGKNNNAKNNTNNKNNNNKNNSKKKDPKKKPYDIDKYIGMNKKDQKKYLKGLTSGNRKKLLASAKKQIEQEKKEAAKQAAHRKAQQRKESKFYLDNKTNPISLVNENSVLYGIEGLPYQFSKEVDPRPEGVVIGRKYGEKIFSRMPLVFLAPCKQKFMDNFTKEERSTALQFLMANTEDFTEDLLNSKGRFYSIEYDYYNYYNYLNPMMVAMASFLGISNKSIRVGGNERKPIKKISWDAESNSNFAHYFSSKENLIFYANEMNTISESFGNDTMESSLASTINGFSDQAKELRFLLNGGAAKTLTENASKAVSSITSSLSGLTTKLGGGLVGSVTKDGINTVVNGGKILFPKIWSDSSYNTSYNINFKFRSPDHDSLSIYLNILKPYAKLLALVMPKMQQNSDEFDVNGYNTPHLVKATCPGFFHIDMGLITGMSVTKGDEGQWNDDGLPTVLDVSIDIEDLYNSVLYMSGYESSSINPVGVFKDPFKFVANTAYMDFLANACGVNIHKPYFERMVAVTAALIENRTVTIPNRIGTSFEQGLTNIIGKMWSKVSI